jgi:hypothetical protein
MISASSAVKGVVSLLIGLFISTIGIDITAGYPRFTFGNVELMGGISFIPAMIGMFAVSEILRYVASTRERLAVPQQSIGNVFRGLGPILGRYKVNLLRGGVIGTAIGILPGAGADIAAWVAYAVSKKFSKEPEKFGTGHVEGLVDTGCANNAGLSGAWVPAIVFGIPGDSITAIRAHGVSEPARADLRGLRSLLRRQYRAGAAGLPGDQVGPPAAAHTQARPDADHSDILCRRRLRDQQHDFRRHGDAGAGRPGLCYGGKRISHRADHSGYCARPHA